MLLDKRDLQIIKLFLCFLIFLSNPRYRQDRQVGQRDREENRDRNANMN